MVRIKADITIETDDKFRDFLIAFASALAGTGISASIEPVPEASAPKPTRESPVAKPQVATVAAPVPAPVKVKTVTKNVLGPRRMSEGDLRKAVALRVEAKDAIETSGLETKAVGALIGENVNWIRNRVHGDIGRPEDFQRIIQALSGEAQQPSATVEPKSEPELGSEPEPGPEPTHVPELDEDAHAKAMFVIEKAADGLLDRQILSLKPHLFDGVPEVYAIRHKHQDMVAWLRNAKSELPEKYDQVKRGVSRTIEPDYAK